MYAIHGLSTIDLILVHGTHLLLRAPRSTAIAVIKHKAGHSPYLTLRWPPEGKKLPFLQRDDPGRLANSTVSCPPVHVDKCPKNKSTKATPTLLDYIAQAKATSDCHEGHGTQLTKAGDVCHCGFFATVRYTRNLKRHRLQSSHLFHPAVSPAQPFIGHVFKH